MFKQLRTFCVVYETGSFTEAAKLLFLSQPTVTVHIQQLENQLQVSLFERTGNRTLTPTNAAAEFYEQAQRLQEQWERDVDQLRKHQSAPLKCRIGASHTIAVYVLPKLMQQLMTAFPLVLFELSMANSDQVAKAVGQHKIDVGLIEKPMMVEKLKRTKIGADELVLAGHGEPWLIREEGSGVHEYTKNYFQETGIIPNHRMTVANNEMILALLREGVGTSIISKRALAHNPEIKYQTLSVKYQRNFYLLNRETAETDNLDQLIVKIRQMLSNMNF